jgi:hypothetical protein
MIKGGTGGGNTLTGLAFERGKDIVSLVSGLPGYSVKHIEGYSTRGVVIYFNGVEVARSLSKHDLYRYLVEQGVKWEKILSKKLLPDEAVYVILNNTLFIIEMKNQERSGSVDEKLQTCDFKAKQYRKLMAPLNIEVEYIYILNDWFRKPCYKDTLDYVISVGCQYYFQYLPLQKLGLPVPPGGVGG